ncbi:hypothetical protein BCR41DRAFT_345732 [Lobosporangium transversale]|uniref:MOSC domain-containing protein n=1 Tax=Lobosporangium transversale TaxID=64571 RepID=A0A1Y2H3R0_9FUNG|nr:hypothetical protein BCR41DRAFT_345732 [Lobosporangium transversale]ORZ27702.1 hypothetical protein BCR41DRAFT_345732 [Lobosporangium transversale]|eukprot:XP_021885405.1 hypothetical protein BCR41DRAFT_345732 [Lobosporangium transversale]
MAPVISKIYIYPIKSCKAVELEESQLSKYGLLHDRVFLVVDPETNKQRTMRELPSMTLIEPKIVGNELVVIAADKTLTLPLVPDISKYEKRTVNVWGDLLESADLGDEAAQFFTDYLGVPSRLVYKSPHHKRPVIEHAPGVAEIGFEPETAFADNYPLLCLSEESMVDVNTHLEKPVSHLNFRPNLLISGVSKPWEEDTWCTVDIRGVTYYFTCRCTRCDMPNIDPETGIKDKLQPQKTLQSVRRVDKGKKAKFFACVGINAVPNTHSGEIRVGDLLEVKEVFEGERMRTGASGWSTKAAAVVA